MQNMGHYTLIHCSNVDYYFILKIKINNTSLVVTLL